MAEIASPLRERTHITGILDALHDELTALPTDPILIYLIESTPPEALYYLAVQFGVTGNNGWRFAATEEEQRALLRQAVHLQKTKGTPGAIINAVSTLGYGQVTITTALGIYYDGTYIADGSILAGAGGGGHWANFRVRVALPEGVSIGPATTEAVTALINAYKNARSVLVDITWVIALADTLDGSDMIEFADRGYVDSLTGGYTYDGTLVADGSVLAGGSNDSLELRILPV